MSNHSYNRFFRGFSPFIQPSDETCEAAFNRLTQEKSWTKDQNNKQTSRLLRVIRREINRLKRADGFGRAVFDEYMLGKVVNGVSSPWYSQLQIQAFRDQINQAAEDLDHADVITLRSILVRLRNEEECPSYSKRSCQAIMEDELFMIILMQEIIENFNH
jgi:hypothetical protein